jgi:hypothetical protein
VLTQRQISLGQALDIADVSGGHKEPVRGAGATPILDGDHVFVLQSRSVSYTHHCRANKITHHIQHSLAELPLAERARRQLLVRRVSHIAELVLFFFSLWLVGWRGSSEGECGVGAMGQERKFCATLPWCCTYLSTADFLVAQRGDAGCGWVV